MSASTATGTRFVSLVAMARTRVREAPDHPAFVFLANGEDPGPPLTNREFYRQACGVGAVLREKGRPGDRVLLLYPPGLEFISGFFGSLFAGMVAVPVSPPDPARMARSLPRLMAIVKDADASFVLTTATVLALAAPLIESAPELKAMEWIAGDSLSCAADDAWRPLDACGDTLAYLQYTSGSTAAPKGVMVTHANVLANLTMLETVCDPVPGETYVTWLPHFHDMGLISLIGPIYGRFTCYVISPLDFLRRPFYWLQAITRYKGGYSAGPNFGYDLCTRKVTEEEQARLDLTSWKLVFNGAEPVRWGALEAFVKRFAPCGFRAEAMCPSYGLAEAVLYVCMSPKTEPPVCLRVKRDALEGHRVAVAGDGDENARELVGCGSPCAGTQVRIVHAERLGDTFRKVSPGEIGEIWVSGPGVTPGYWRNPEATEAAFNGRLADTGEGPFLRTGDLGFVRDGNLFVTGRAKDLIIVRGANHYPEDIEGTVSKSHKALRPGCAAAFSVEADGEERIVVVQEVRDEFLKTIEGAPPVERQDQCGRVVRAVRNAVALDHQLSTYAVVLIRPRSLPKTSSGKIRRGATKTAFLEGSLEVVEQDMLDIATTRERAPAGEAVSIRTRLLEAPVARRQGMLEGYLRKVLARALNIHEDEIAAAMPFLDLGLDSMKAMELLGSIERDLQIRLDPKRLFDQASIQALANYLTTVVDEPGPAAQDRYALETEEGSV